jgi:hypothetical protein
MASDFFASAGVGALCIVIYISAVLYLPLSPPSARHNQVIIGQQRSHHANQLMSMLREGGWEDLDESDVKSPRDNDAPFASADMRGVSWTAGPDERWGRQGQGQATIPTLLKSFQSPIGKFSLVM